MTLKEACKHALTILKQVMEEKLNSTNVEVSIIANMAAVSGWVAIIPSKYIANF